MLEMLQPAHEMTMTGISSDSPVLEKGRGLEGMGGPSFLLGLIDLVVCLINTWNCMGGDVQREAVKPWRGERDKAEPFS